MQTKEKRDRFSALFIFTAGALWGSMGLFVRNLGDSGLTSSDIVEFRGIVTAILLFVWLLITDRKLLRVRPADLWCFAGTGILSITFFNLCYFRTIELTSLSVAAVLLYTAPAFVILFSAILFGEKISGRKIGALALTLAGCVCVSGLLRGGGSLTPAGFLTGLGAGLGYALYSIFSRFALERGYRSLTISFYTFLFAVFGTLPFVSLSNIRRAALSGPATTGFIVLFGLVTTVFPYILYTRGLEGVENGRAAIIASVEPVVATVLGIVVFHEFLHPDEAAGIALILLAIFISNRSESRGRQNKSR